MRGELGNAEGHCLLLGGHLVRDLFNKSKIVIFLRGTVQKREIHNKSIQGQKPE